MSVTPILLAVWSWNENFVLCFEMIANDQQSQSWKANFVPSQLGWLLMIGSASPGMTTLCETSVNIWQCWSWNMTL